MAVDSVNEYVINMQQILELLGYNPGRQDGYFSNQTKIALEQFEKDYKLTVDGILDEETYKKLLVENMRYYYSNQDIIDLQLKKGLEVLK